MNQVLAKRYELVERIGSGGMGVVWRAHDRTLHRTVAVKVIAGPGVSAEAVSRLEREARAAAGLSQNRHVVTVHDFGHEGAGTDGGDCAYVVMELVDGRTLDRVLAQDGLPGPARAVEWARQVCVALDAAHAIGVVHRDIKPSNVILGPDGVIQVLDFGLAWFHPELGLGRLSRSDAVMGSAPWMSPEQAQGKTVDHRSDLYSLGCLLFELLTGAPPFGGRDALAQLVAHVMEEPRAPSGNRNGESSIGTHIPPRLDRLVLDLLAKSPDDRPFSASLVAARLGGIREGLGEVSTEAVPPLPPLPENVPAVASPPVAPAEVRDMRSRPSRRQFLVIAVGVVVTSTSVVVPYLLPDSDDGAGSDGGSRGGGEGEKSSPPRRLWDIPLAPSARLPEAAAGPVVLVDLLGDNDYAGFQVRDARSGDVRWTFNSVRGSGGDPETFGVDLDPGGTTAYITLPGKVVARDTTTGHTRWTYEPKGGGVTTGTASLAFAEGVVYVTNMGRVVAVASGDGSELWTVPLDDTTITTVLVGRVLLVRAMLHLYAVSVDAKRVVWQKRTEKSELLIGNGIVFVTPPDTGAGEAPPATLAIGIDDGTERWSDASAPHSVLAARNLAVYLSKGGDLLRVRSLDTGKKLYEKAIPSSARNSPQLVGDILVSPVSRGEEEDLAGIGLDGTVRWRKPSGNILNLDGMPYGKVLVTDPTNKSLRALDLTTGEDRWTVTPDEKRMVLEANRLGNLLFIITGEFPLEGPLKAERLYCLALPDAT